MTAQLTGAGARSAWRLRFDWGPTGALAVGDGADVVVVVDVLSFTTAVSVAVDGGMAVLPYPSRDGDAAEHARRRGAALAVPRSAASPGDLTLSPASLRDAVGVHRVVLPSPNGSTIAHALAHRAGAVVAGSLRNAGAVARWIAAQVRDEDAVVAVVAAGERWPDGSLRPAVEDLWGAGAVLAALSGAPGARPTPEACAAVGAYREVAGDVPAALRACVSGVELAGSGWSDDVALAAEVGAGRSVPILRDGAFVAA
ncbi:2-phosphosulfolactate phosphatase [Cellulomonas pakistanensis]|uniref:Probable 2-phosphosulfolactate phosphatase n=1 Tax=Cellulomonas pakistanensis TaxID=992287 RepID=A0A919U3Z9_9CELL|nr:2-phosphosulfolactate phosphatase [Cellulomonas pakistanensis]GIG36911.1 hypothetical protein Cpa01nite_22920 [Cellulomonas pakistanensis]